MDVEVIESNQEVEMAEPDTEENVNEDVEDNDDFESNTEIENIMEHKITSAVETTRETAEDVHVNSDQCCPICMDPWTSSGEHRLCCLRCGHLYGHCCILRWLQVSCNSTNRRCPQCNGKAAVKDIRMLYAKKLTSIDTSEIEKLNKELTSVRAEKIHLERELFKCNGKQRAYEQQIANMRSRISELEKQQSQMHIHLNDSFPKFSNRKFHPKQFIEVPKGDDCRVLEYNEWYKFLIVSQRSSFGYGVRKIDSEKFQPGLFTFLHSKALRDIKFHETQMPLLLSVGFDKYAKLTNLENNITVHAYQTEFPLWSCCWSGYNPNIFFAGACNGTITQFDIRQTSGAMEVLDSPGDRSPVASLATVPANSVDSIMNGGFIACRLTTCYVYAQQEGNYVPKPIFLEGPFVSVLYDKKNNHVLISSRPNARQPHARHVVCTIEEGKDRTPICNVVHTFHAGNSQQLLSRPCHINIENDTLVAAHQESTRSISLWSISSGKLVQTLPVSDPVIDLCPIDINNNLFLATLSANKIIIYTHGQVQ